MAKLRDPLPQVVQTVGQVLSLPFPDLHLPAPQIAQPKIKVKNG